MDGGGRGVGTRVPADTTPPRIARLRIGSDHGATDGAGSPHSAHSADRMRRTRSDAGMRIRRRHSVLTPPARLRQRTASSGHMRATIARELSVPPLVTSPASRYSGGGSVGSGSPLVAITTPTHTTRVVDLSSPLGSSPLGSSPVRVGAGAGGARSDAAGRDRTSSDTSLPLLRPRTRRASLVVPPSRALDLQRARRGSVSGEASDAGADADSAQDIAAARRRASDFRVLLHAMAAPALGRTPPPAPGTPAAASRVVLPPVMFTSLADAGRVVRAVHQPSTTEFGLRAALVRLEAVVQRHVARVGLHHLAVRGLTPGAAAYPGS